MKYARPCFIALYLAVLIFYFYSETGDSFKRRAINKIALSTLFLGWAAICAKAGSGFGLPYILALVALLFCWGGDTLLLWSFTGGGKLFGVGNILFFVYELLLCARLGVGFPALLWALPLFLIPVAGMALAAFRGGIDFGGDRILVLSYIASVSLHGSLGLVMAVSRPTPFMLTTGLGLFLFMFSDYVLIPHRYKYRSKKSLLRLNSATYFTGMLLVATSLGLAL